MRAARLRLPLVLKREIVASGPRMVNALEETDAHGKALIPRKRKATEADALAEEEVQEEVKEKETPRNKEKAQEKEKANKMAKSLSELLQPTRPKNEASHLRAKKIALLAITTLKVNAIKELIAIGGIPRVQIL